MALAATMGSRDTVGMTTDRLGMTVLENKTCPELLRTQSVGRLAVAIREHPDIFPINVVRIEPAEITGRRFQVVEPSLWSDPVRVEP